MRTSPSRVATFVLVSLVSACSSSSSPDDGASAPDASVDTSASSDADASIDASATDGASGDATDAPPSDATDARAEAAADGGAGALIDVSTTSQVGVLLDELPASVRDRVAADLLSQPAAFWIARAHRQLALATYRLNFRAGFYNGDPSKKQLPLPPDEVFTITLAADGGTGARRAMVDGHDYVLVDYSLAATIVTDAASPGTSEPALASVGGTWDEPFTFPVDPELLLQRTGYACMDESEFPPNSVDSEDVEFFYDQTCDVEPMTTPTGCHYTALPVESCVDALTAHVGKVDTNMHYARVAWDDAKAGAARVGSVTNTTGSDLEVVKDELGVNRLTYRYIPAGSCALAEQCVGGSGWRRLLQFNASEQNRGTQPVNIGDVDYFLDNPDASTPNANHHIYEYSECHHHFHFTHYATFTYGGDPTLGSKRAFCLESVARYANHEASPTWSPYGTCAFQGISAGWGDRYNAGIECQWVDVTTIDTSAGAVTRPLGLRSNPDGFLCEGQPVLDAMGQIVWEPTMFRDMAGDVVDRPKCDFFPNWDANDYGELDVTLPLPGEGMITAPCTRGQTGRLRNCGYTHDHTGRDCTPGATTTLSCSVPAGAAPQAIRVCEASRALGAGTACLQADALAGVDVESSAAVDVTFTCPAARDAIETGGRWALYTGPSAVGDTAATVTCVPK